MTNHTGAHVMAHALQADPHPEAEQGRSGLSQVEERILAALGLRPSGA